MRSGLRTGSHPQTYIVGAGQSWSGRFAQATVGLTISATEGGRALVSSEE